MRQRGTTVRATSVDDSECGTLKNGTGSVIRAVVLTVPLMLCAEHVVAQPPARYQPSKPIFSPYLNLLRRDPGQILPSYQAYVLPRIQSRQFRQQQVTEVRRLDNGLRQVRQGESIPTGVSGQFGNKQRFFGTSPAYFRTHQRRP